MQNHAPAQLQNIIDRLREAGPSGMVLIGVGNTDRADDGAGIELAARLGVRFPGRIFSEMERSVESLVLDHIENENTRVILMVDATSFGAAPGDMLLFTEEHIDSMVMDMSTHKVPVSFLMNLIRKHGKTPFLLGIQPGSLSFLGVMTGSVKAAVDALEASLGSLFETET